MRCGHLFNGIGGFPLAASWMGWLNIMHCEIDAFCNRVMNHHFPNSFQHEDIRTTDFSIWRGRIDLLTGGFPCQPYSSAGKRKGTADDRHLWPEMLRAIREISPRWIVAENVRGLTNWNGGVVFDQVQADMEAEGYEVIPFLLPAAGVGAPHRRDRIWFIAYAADNTRNDESGNEGQESCQIQEKRFDEFIASANTTSGRHNTSEESELHTAENGIENANNIGYAYSSTEHGNASHTSNQGLQGCQNNGSIGGSGKERNQQLTGLPSSAWENFPTQPPVRAGNDGLPGIASNRTISNENSMDRSLVIYSALNDGRMQVDFLTGKIYSTRQRGKEGQLIELFGADCNGYLVHNIMYNGIKKQCRAHQIVWIAANGLYDKEFLMIDHINRNKKDNRLANLRLVDAKANRENQAPRMGKLNQEQKDQMFILYAQGNMSMKELAEDFGISKSRVQQILSEHSGLVDITVSKWAEESLTALGNAIVPQVALEIYKAIEQYNLHP